MASLTGLAKPRSHTAGRILNHRGSHAPLTETNTQQGLGPLHGVRPREVPELSPICWCEWVSQWTGPTLGHQPPHLPYREDSWSRAHLGGASTATVLQVGLARYDVPSQATTDLEHSPAQDSLMKRVEVKD